MTGRPTPKHHPSKWKHSLRKQFQNSFQHQRMGSNNNQQQLKTTSDVTSKFPRVVALLYCEVEQALDVESDDPPDEALSCRRRRLGLSLSL